MNREEPSIGPELARALRVAMAHLTKTQVWRALQRTLFAKEPSAKNRERLLRATLEHEKALAVFDVLSGTYAPVASPKIVFGTRGGSA